MFGILGSIAVGSGQTFPTFEDLFRDLKARMSKEGFKVVKSRTHRNKVAGNYEKGSEVVRCDLVCDRGGQPYKCTATQLKTTTKKTNCPWRAKAVNRKTLGAWVLTVICDQHNHEPRTPEPPSEEEEEEEDADADGDAEIVEEDTSAPQLDGPAPDPDTSTALAVAGVSANTMRLTGDTFHNFKGEYRRMSKPERIGILAQLQMRIAAIYAIENEDLQRQERQARQERKHQEIEGQNRRRTQSEQHQQQQQHQHHQQQHQHQQPPPPPQQQQQQQQHMPQPQHHQQQSPHHQQPQQPMAHFAHMVGGGHKHPFQQTPEEEQAQAQERRRHLTQIAREHLGTPVQQAPMQQAPMPSAMQQTPVQQTPVPVPQFGMQSAPGSQNIFRHYAGTPPQHSATGTPVAGSAPPKRRGRPPKNATKATNGAA